MPVSADVAAASRFEAYGRIAYGALLADLQPSVLFCNAARAAALELTGDVAELVVHAAAQGPALAGCLRCSVGRNRRTSHHRWSQRYPSVTACRRPPPLRRIAAQRSGIRKVHRGPGASASLRSRVHSGAPSSSARATKAAS